MGKRFWARVGAYLAAAFFGMFAAVRTVLDVIGYSTVSEDLEHARGLMDQVLSQVLATPWYVPWAGFAVLSAFLMYLAMPQPAPILFSPRGGSEAPEKDGEASLPDDEELDKVLRSAQTLYARLISDARIVEYKDEALECVKILRETKHDAFLSPNLAGNKQDIIDAASKQLLRRSKTSTGRPSRYDEDGLAWLHQRVNDLELNLLSYRRKSM